MTRDDIIRMARQVGFVLDEADFIYPNPRRSGIQLELERFAALVAQHEREACRRAFDAYLLTSDPGPLRARGNA
jgi:hypothetical protein